MSEQPDQGTASEQQSESHETSSRSYGRRALMLGTAAAGAGAAVSLVAWPGAAGAETPDTAKKAVLGKANTATATTSISMAVDNDSGIQGIDESTGGGYGVFGTSANGIGVYGTSANGIGIYGTITGATSGQYAIEGVDQSTGSGGGAGVTGSSTNGTGVIGTSTNGAGVTGIHGTGVGSAVAGVDESGSDASHGVYGNSANGFGIYGTSSDGDGVYGTSNDGAGVFGISTGDSSWGVYGAATGSYGFGVYAESGEVGGYGVYASATGFPGEEFGLGAYGVYAYSIHSFAVYADGNAEVTGSLSKGGGSFKIDHPVDPANKYLYHSFVESPDMMNVYNGNVVLDQNGRATVELPEWFEDLNRDFRYQLTAIGAPTVVYISEKIVEGKFGIAGGNPRQEVSWQVTGIRQDAWANANRIPVEVDKNTEDQGRYLHPELFGGKPITALAKARNHGRRHHSNDPAV